MHHIIISAKILGTTVKGIKLYFIY